MVRFDDTLELLLPSAEPELARRARSTVQFLRLLAADARAETAGRVAVDFERARGDLEGHFQLELRAALVELLRSYLAHALGADSFLWLGSPRCESHDCWALLLEARAERPWLPSLPAPGEAVCLTASRVLAAAERLDPGHGEWELWRARGLRIEQGLAAGEAGFRRGLESCLESGSAPASLLSAWIAGTCECLLDRGAVREARSLLLERGQRGSPSWRGLSALDGRLSQLLGWCKLLLGDAAGARALLVGRRFPDGSLSGALHALRARVPEWVAWLPQRFQESGSAPLASPAARGRTDVGASVCVHFELDSQGGLAVRRADVAPGLRAGLDEWISEQRFAPTEPGSLQQRLVLEQRTLFAHRLSDRWDAARLGGEHTLALALVPLAGTDGRLAGWLHLEFEHHLVPREARLLEWARSLALQALPARTIAAVRPAGDAACTERLFRELVERAGLRAPQRHWWGFHVRDGRPELVAEGGDAPPETATLEGRGALLERVLLTGGSLGFAEPSPELSLGIDSHSGCAYALGFQGRVLGILAVESCRPGDSELAGVRLPEEWLATEALRLHLESFRAVHREAHGADVWFDVDSPDLRAFCGRLFRAAESDCAVLIAGPPGCGKTVLGRLVHHVSRRAGAALVELRRSALATDSAWRATLSRARSGTLLLEEVERLDAEAAERLLGWIESRRSDPDRASRPRLIATTSAPFGEPGPEAALGTGLARRLESIRFDIPRLRERRSEIPALAARLLERVAHEERSAVPAIEDEALACLWRQNWEQNLVELEGTLHRALLFAPGRPITLELLERLALLSGRSLVRRLPSRHPSRSDLASALRTTRLGTGRVNKTRAAAFLGWDPDTLVARLSDLGMDPNLAPSSTSWEPDLAQAGPDAGPDTD
ncbi:MAG: sigma 54-interacting transcriptional regulator [Planctomycetes bacterium]|nr:sigma 54-interacting transcriptional regulator [Planctomycetota bacterium]